MLNNNDLVRLIEEKISLRVKDCKSSLLLWPNQLNAVDVLYILQLLSNECNVDLDMMILSLKDNSITIDNICNVINKLQQ